MQKDKLHIIDNLFTHANSSSWYNKPEKFEWDRSLTGEHIIITDNLLQMVDRFDHNKKYAWLIESPLITPHAYKYIRDNHSKFDLIFTFNKELLNISDKFIFIPIGGCWIREDDRVISEKSKNLSIILSSKRTTLGHRLRHSIIEKYPNIDTYGFNNHIENKIIGLKDYRFSIIIENCKEDYYFTEKLIDSFITGTIPIYWGCPSIGDFFNTDGMITFNDLDDFASINEIINENYYNSRIDIIRENYELAKKYLIADDLIYNFLKK